MSTSTATGITDVLEGLVELSVIAVFLNRQALASIIPGRER
jgi:hypothetical protein